MKFYPLKAAVDDSSQADLMDLSFLFESKNMKHVLIKKQPKTQLDAVEIFGATPGDRRQPTHFIASTKQDSNN